MRIHQCERCEGCGYVTGGFRWEIPWSRWANPENQEAESLLDAKPCPDCVGTGALIEMDAAESLPRLVSRRGLPRDAYASHVAAILELRNPE